MNKLWSLLLLPWLAGCASVPYTEVRFAGQVNGMSDWVLQPERKWTPDESEFRVHLQVGTEWQKDVSCFGEVMMVGPWDQAFLGCSKQFGDRFTLKTSLMHQLDSRTSEFLKTNQKQWQGHNPFFHVRVGYQINPAFSVGISSGKSLFQGAPFEKEEGAPDLYWTNYDVSVRLWGQRGLFSNAD